MPRLSTPDPLALAVGNRIKKLREDAGLTIERLAYESDMGSKGHLSSLEKGLVRPTVHTLKILAEGLGVSLLDLVTFPDDTDREKLIDVTRYLSAPQIRRLLRLAEGATATSNQVRLRPQKRL